MAKYVVAISLFLLATFSSYAQDSVSKRCMLWDEPYDYAIGFSCNYSNVTNVTLGLDWRCRWFGISIELGNDVHSIPISDDAIVAIIKEQAYLLSIEDVNVKGFSRQYFMISLSAHFHYFSLGIGWGANDWNFCADGNIQFLSVQTHLQLGESLSMRHYWIRPFVEGHIPIMHNEIVLSPKIGYGISLHINEIQAYKPSYGLCYGIGISKTF